MIAHQLLSHGNGIVDDSDVFAGETFEWCHTHRLMLIWGIDTIYNDSTKIMIEVYPWAAYKYTQNSIFKRKKYGQIKFGYVI